MENFAVQVYNRSTGMFHSIIVSSSDSLMGFLQKYISSLLLRNRLNPICRGYRFLLDGEEITGYNIRALPIPPAIIHKMRTGASIIALEDSSQTASKAIEYALGKLRRASSEGRYKEAQRAEDLFRALAGLERTERILKMRIQAIGRLISRIDDVGEIQMASDRIQQKIIQIRRAGADAVELLRANPL